MLRRLSKINIMLQVGSRRTLMGILLYLLAVSTLCLFRDSCDERRCVQIRMSE